MNKYKSSVCNQLSISDIKKSVLFTLPIFKKLCDTDVMPQTVNSKMWCSLHDMLAMGGENNFYGNLEIEEVWAKYEKFIKVDFMKFTMEQIDNHIQSVFEKDKKQKELMDYYRSKGATVISI